MDRLPPCDPTTVEINMAKDVEAVRHVAMLARQAEDVFARRAVQDNNYLRMTTLVLLTDLDAAAGRVAMPYTRRRMLPRMSPAFTHHRAWLSRIAAEASQAAALVESRGTPVPFAWAHTVKHLRNARKLAAHLIADATAGDVDI